MQDDMARVIMAMTGEEAPVFQLTAEEEASVGESFRQAERGEFATDERCAPSGLSMVCEASLYPPSRRRIGRGSFIH